MCGIAGILSRTGDVVHEGVLRLMNDAIAHRGPDDSGTHIDGPLGMANRRLAVIDITPAGHQPMHTPDGRYTIVYNGEIYNFMDLRDELRGSGERMRSHTDTEVVLRAYREWGPACVERFNGMFALAIWDRDERTLFLARDRYGIKPLYWTHAGGQLLFGSEVKSFLQHPAFKVRVSEEHLLEYFTFQNLFTDGTLFGGVRMFPAGSHATLRPGDSDVRPTSYWDWEFAEPDSGAACRPEEHREELDRLFRQAVQRQLVSDVPVGSHLSGGMDSGSITALAARELPYLATFTVGFDMTSSGGLEMGADERTKAEAMSYVFKTEHFESVLKAGDMERCLPSLVWHLEDLRVGQSYPNWYVSRLASKFVTVVLSGSGGDELFAGYPWRYYRAVVNDDFDHYVEKYYRFWHRLVPDEYRAGLFRPEVWDRLTDVRTEEIFRAVFVGAEAPSSPEDYVNHSLYLEAKTFLHGLLVVEDKLSMAHSLETRVPFLDNDLVDFALRVPVKLKLRDLDKVVKLDENEPGGKSERFFQRTRDGKLILRQVMARHVPERVTDRVKQGFSGPDASWFRGDSIDYVRDVLLDPGAKLYDFFSPEGVRAMVEQHLDGRENRRLLLWSLLSFEHWCRTFLHGHRP
ncbi:MAG TPA: asparagine synthase (glutamine-hydrolyzing) [Solirubrobacteraceae bacterium]|nr:asparagine synthase (glutamine-hydrolyzing) [Solirubrobacteraceae bacterium]